MIKFIRYWIRNVLGFSKTETNGLPILVLVVIVFFLAPRIYDWYGSGTYSASAEDKVILDSLIVSLSGPAPTSEEEVPHQFEFNPNYISFDSLLLLGIRSDIARRIVNYRNAGGSFEVKKDLQKIYGLSSEQYEKLSNLMSLPEERLPKHRNEYRISDNKFESENPEPVHTGEKVASLFDINSADTSQLKRIYGIGTVLSARIIKYRDLLGGFVKKEQLKEVYGIKEEVYGALAEQSFIADNYIPERININRDSVQQIAAHPYVSYNMAKTIINYRLQHGPFQEKSDLLKIHLFDSVQLKNIVPYIDL